MCKQNKRGPADLGIRSQPDSFLFDIALSQQGPSPGHHDSPRVEDVTRVSSSAAAQRPGRAPEQKEGMQNTIPDPARNDQEVPSPDRKKPKPDGVPRRGLPKPGFRNPCGFRTPSSSPPRPTPSSSTSTPASQRAAARAPDRRASGRGREGKDRVTGAEEVDGPSLNGVYGWSPVVVRRGEISHRCWRTGTF